VSIGPSEDTIRGTIKINVREAVRAYAQVRAANQRTLYALRGSSDSFIRNGRNMALVGAGMLAALGKMVIAAGQFESNMTFFKAITNDSEKAVDRLGQAAIDMSKNSIYSADEIAAGFVELGKAGLDAKDVIDGVGQGMVDLGAATDIGLTQSGQIIISTMGQFKKGAEDTTRVVNILTGAANASQADISDIGVAMKYAGSVARAAGANLQDTATAIAILANDGIRGSTAGTSLRQMLVSLPGVTGPAQDALEELGIITKDGTNRFYDMQGSLKPLPEVYQLLRTSLAGYSRMQQLVYLRQIFNNRAVTAAIDLTDAGAKGFKEMYGEMSRVTAADTASRRLDNLSGDILKLKANIHALVLEQGGPLQNSMRTWVQRLTKLIQWYGKLPEGVQKAIIQIISFSGAALVAMGSISFVIGVVLKFLKNAKDMGAALLFLRRLFFGVSAATAAASDGTLAASAGLLGAIPVVGWIILAVVALIAILVALYVKLKGFREWVNKYIVDPSIEAAKWIAQFSVALWNKMVPAIQAAWNWMKKLGGIFADGVTDVKNFITNAVNFFKGLPGQVGAFFRKLPGLIWGFLNPTHLLPLLARGWAKVVGFFIKLPLEILKILLEGLDLMWKAMAKILPLFGKVLGFIIGFVLGFTIRLVYLFLKAMVNLGIAVVKGLGNLLVFFIKGIGKIISWLWRNAPRLAQAFLSELRALPGQVWKIFTRVVSFLIKSIPRLAKAGLQLAQGITKAISEELGKLPSQIWGLLGDITSLIKDMVKQAFDAAWGWAKGLASGFWNGIKKGLHIGGSDQPEDDGGNSEPPPDMPELGSAMAQAYQQAQDKINRNQSLLRSSANQARADRANQAAGRLAAPQVQVQVAPKKNTGPGRTRLVSGRLSLDRSGRAFIQGVAQDDRDDDQDYDVTVNRMRRQP